MVMNIEKQYYKDGKSIAVCPHCEEEHPQEEFRPGENELVCPECYSLFTVIVEIKVK